MSLQSLHYLLGQQAQDVSSAVFVYTTTPTAPFGELLTTAPSTAQVFNMQTRPGAGAALVGFVESIAFTSKGAAVNATSVPATTAADEEEVSNSDAGAAAAANPAKRTLRSAVAADDEATLAKRIKTGAVSVTRANALKPVAVLTSTASFLSLVPSLLALPAAAVRPSLAVHVSAQAGATDGSDDPTLVQVPDLAALFEGVQHWDASGWTGAVIFSESAEEAALVGTGLAPIVNSAGCDLVNVFDGLSAGRELSHLAASTLVAPTSNSLNDILASALPFFTYSGSATATSVLVLPASTYSATARAALAALTHGGEDVGILSVRVVKPWNASAFVAALPASAKTLHLYAEASDDSVVATSPFYSDVVSTLVGSPIAAKLKLRALPLAATSVPTVAKWAAIILAIASPEGAMPAVLASLLPAQASLAVFWDLDSTAGQTELVASHLARALSASATGVQAKVDTVYDNFKQGGLQCSTLLLEPVGAAVQTYSLSAIAATAAPGLLFLSSPAAVLKAYAPLSASTVNAETRIVLSVNWTPDEVADKLPVLAKNALAAVSNGTSGNLYVVDTDKLAADNKVQAADVAEVVFWSCYLPTSISSAEIFALLVRTPTFKAFDPIKLTHLISSVRAGIRHVEITAAWSEVAAVDASATIPAALSTALVPTAAGPNADRTFADPTAKLDGTPASSWFSIAQRLLFPEAFALSTVLEEKMRPDLPEKNYVVTVTENRRLTPGNYDRNVFHLEFSTVGTGLQYTVGEALGIHGWNDEEEVREFIAWYGLDADAVISFPAKDDPHGRVEHRTVFQILQQTLDLFGKPGKAFYETLSRYATNKDQERALRFIACAEGNATFKKMSDVDTLTYADVMRMFPSAKPGIEELVREIEEIKPRHYSIASSQNFVGDSVHLLVVTVEWEDPKGRTRFGQCTRYLDNLKVGQQVMVSVKPSVMKLPARDTQPIIMAGLGTGAAPFRAFIQERAWQKAQGMDVGPALYYFGSRHRSKEYLYGEEIEAYVNEGVITHTGLAFSRDTDKKVYIQHKMNEDAELLATMLEDGVFYLCGPTWPVPDVYEALVKSFVGKGKTVEAAQAYIEELKEEERYVLEVY